MLNQHDLAEELKLQKSQGENVEERYQKMESILNHCNLKVANLMKKVK